MTRTIRLANSPDGILAGHPTSDGRRLDECQDVTSDALRAVIEHVGVGRRAIISVDGEDGYMIAVGRPGDDRCDGRHEELDDDELLDRLTDAALDAERENRHVTLCWHHAKHLLRLASLEWVRDSLGGMLTDKYIDEKEAARLLAATVREIRDARGKS
jgi:hypothetical protein